jgi:hypothetical protein
MRSACQSPDSNRVTKSCVRSFSGSSVTAQIAASRALRSHCSITVLDFPIGILRSLDIPLAQEHVSGGLVRIRLREPRGQCEQLIDDLVRLCEFADLSEP